MSDSESDHPPQGQPAPGESLVPSPTNPPQETMVERGLFPGLLGMGDDDGDGNEPPPQPVGRRQKKLRSEMGFLEHLEELRMTIVKSAFTIAIGMVLVGMFFIKFFAFLRYPIEKALGPELAEKTLISLEPMGPVSMVFSISIYGGAILALPVVAYFIVQFIAPGLTLREKGMLRPALLSAIGLFFTGAMTCFFIMLPPGLKFSYALGKMLGLSMQWSVNSYISLVVWATLATGLMFEFPLILVILQVLGVIETNTLRRCRRYAVIIIAVVGGLLAPSPDPGSMIMMMVPMLLLYEAAIVIGALLRRRRLAAQASADAENAG